MNDDCVDVLPHRFRFSSINWLYILKATKTVLDIREPIETSLSCVNDTQMLALNAQYRQKNISTDVLSFALEEAIHFPVATNTPRHIGDIYLCVPYVRRQAHKLKKTEEEEMIFVFIHSLLHLFGFDHQTDAQEKQMNQLTEQILATTSI